MFRIAYILIATLSITATTAFASGGYSNSQASKVDKAYEYGKAIYSGRISSVGKINFCVTQGDEKIKVKRASLKPYAGKPINELADNLFDCDMPEERIFDKLGKKNMQHVLYYLNKRYKLKLIQS